ncbi:MAG TPA: LemA family protein [Vicinamibacteria bacterium]|nr:LemA family protein [Vicinamibacteria bacterium]
MSPILAVVIAAAALVAVLTISTYNRLVRLRNGTENAFGALDAQLKNRFDLVPNVVAAVGSYMKHERSLLESLTSMRAQALGAGVTPEQRVALDGQVARGFQQLLVAVESYPDLKASQQFDHLQRTLVEVESQIAAARRAYNASVTELNNGVQAFPASVVAGISSFRRKPVLETPESERGRVDVGALLSR